MSSRSHLILSAVLLLESALVQQARAQGGKRPEPPRNMKRVVQIEDFPNRYIEMPGVEVSRNDTLVYAYGKNISDRIVANFVSSDRFIVINPFVESSVQGLVTAEQEEGHDDDPVRLREVWFPSLEVKGRVKELNFRTGERAESAFYGFRPGYENAYNGGAEPGIKNEFSPVLLPNDNQSGFGNLFNDTGGLHTGKEIGSELNFDLFFLGAMLKKAHFKARMGVELELTDTLTHESRTRHVNIEADGIYVEIGGHYLGYTVGITAARRAAMHEAFNSASTVLASTLQHELMKQKVITQLSSVRNDYFIPVGSRNLRIKTGQRFYSRSAWERGEQPAVFQTENIYATVSKLKLMSRYGKFNNGDRLVSLLPNEPPPPLQSRTIASSLSASSAQPETVNLRAATQELDVIKMLLSFVENMITRFFKGLEALVTFPFRVARFFQYDQGYNGGEIWHVDLNRARQLARGNWALEAIGAPEAWKSSLGANNVIVAVLDTGIDYNHDELRRSIFFDGTGNTPGFDFFADDARPYDDHAHGTAVASVIAGGGRRLIGVAPRVTVMPVKVFSSYGVTSSAALYQGFQYAIEKGAKVIVTGWGTPVASQALRDGIRLAQANRVLVVAAAGDNGQDLAHKPHYPAAFAEEFDNVVVVAGTDRNGRTFRAAGPLGLSSNYGGADTIGAPASDVTVAAPRNEYKEGHYSGIGAGFVGGAAAWVWSACPNLSPVDVKNALIQGAKSSGGGEKVLYLPGVASVLHSHCENLSISVN